MKLFPIDPCAPPSTLRAPDTDPDTDPCVDDRPTDVDPIPAPSFKAFGELTDSELREFIKSQQTPLPLSRRSAPPSSERTFVVYERIVDTRRLRRGAVRERSSVIDLLAFVVFVGLFTGITAVAAIVLSPDPITSQRNARSSAGSIPGAHPKLP